MPELAEQGNHPQLTTLTLWPQLCLIGETRLWMKSTIKLREENDDLSRRMASIEQRLGEVKLKSKFATADSMLFNQASGSSTSLLHPCWAGRSNTGQSGVLPVTQSAGHPPRVPPTRGTLRDPSESCVLISTAHRPACSPCGRLPRWTSCHEKVLLPLYADKLVRAHEHHLSAPRHPLCWWALQCMVMAAMSAWFERPH